VGRRRAPEIQDGGQITGSTNNFASFTDTHVVATTIHGFTTMYETSQSPANHGRRYLVSKIQDGGQLTGNSNISKTMKHIIKLPTATTMFSGPTFLAVVLRISWDVHVR